MQCHSASRLTKQPICALALHALHVTCCESTKPRFALATLGGPDLGMTDRHFHPATGLPCPLIAGLTLSSSLQVMLPMLLNVVFDPACTEGGNTAALPAGYTRYICKDREQRF